MLDQSQIKLVFMGDIALGGEFCSYVEKSRVDYLHPFQLINKRILDADVVLANLEGPISEHSNKRPNVTAILWNHPSIIEYFREFNISVLNLANNHIMDYGLKGFEHTLMSLRRNSIYSFGAGKNADYAYRECTLEIKGKRIAFLGFTSNQRHVNAIISSKETAGCASFLQIPTIIKKIEKLREKVDVICISLHWGHEYFLYPSSEQINIARAFVDAGANFVVGHHPHCVQGIEKYKGSLIFYSLGNLFMPPIRTTSGRTQLKKDISNEFMIIKSKIKDSENIEFEIVGGKMSKDYLLIDFNSIQQKEFENKIEKLSKPLYCTDYTSFWRNYKKQRVRQLNTESLVEAFRKLSKISYKELFRTIKMEDIKRNLIRLYKSISN